MSYEKHKAGLAVDYMKLEQTPIEKAIWSVLDEYCDAENHPLKEYDLVCDVLQKVEEAVSKCTFTGWIPCSERLPEEYGNYLVTTDKDVDIGTFNPNKAKWSCCDADGFYWTHDIIAWMPLPPAFVEGDKE